MKRSDILRDKYLLLLVMITLLYAAYWVYYGNFMFTNYRNGFFDMGIETYSVYWHLHGNFSLGAFQYLVFANHLSPFEILLLPAFALYQYPMTLLVLQDTSLAFVAVAIYIACKNLLKNAKIGFSLAIARFINPGVGGLLFFDFHPEAFIPLFFVLAFYFYMKRKSAYFLLTYALLVSVVELATFIGGTLLAALFIYESLYNSKGMGKDHDDHSKGLRLLLYGLVLTAIFGLAYFFVGNYLLSNYSTVSYASLPPLIYYGNYTAAQINLILHPSNFSYNVYDLYAGGVLGLLVLFFWFGFASLRNPVLSIVLCSPWFIAAFILHYPIVTSFVFQYYGYALGGSVVSAILGSIVLTRHDAKHSTLDKWKKKMILDRVFPYMIPFLLLLCFSVYIVSGLPVSIIEIAMMPAANYSSAINAAVSTIPQNSSVMSGGIIAAHLFYIRNLELIPVPTNYFPAIGNDTDNLLAPHNTKTHWFRPEYLIIDKNLDAGSLNTTSFNLTSYTRYNYTLVYNKSGAMIFKMNS